MLIPYLYITFNLKYKQLYKMNLYITKSTRKNKTYDLLDTDKKYLLSFGDSIYQDYTMHKKHDRTKTQLFIQARKRRS